MAARFMLRLLWLLLHLPVGDSFLLDDHLLAGLRLLPLRTLRRKWLPTLLAVLGRELRMVLLLVLRRKLRWRHLRLRDAFLHANFIALLHRLPGICLRRCVLALPLR